MEPTLPFNQLVREREHKVVRWFSTALLSLLCIAPLLSCGGPQHTPVFGPLVSIDTPQDDDTCLRVEVVRLPERVSWNDIAVYCASGVFAPGDIELIDARATVTQPVSADVPCFRVAWTNGLAQRWEGNPCNRGRTFELCGVSAARALVRPITVWESLSAFHMLREVGWEAEAVQLADFVWADARLPDSPSHHSARLLLESAMRELTEPTRVALFEKWTSEAIEGAQIGLRERDRRRTRVAEHELIKLAEHAPAGIAAASLIKRMRDADLVSTNLYCSVLHALRIPLVAEGAYAAAVDDDPDPVGAFSDEAFWRDLASLPFALVPAALLPVPYARTNEERAAVKEGALEMFKETQRADGIALYEALIARGRTREATRLEALLEDRCPTKPLPAATTPALQTLRDDLEQMIPRGSLTERLEEARERAESRVTSPAVATPQP